MIGGDDIGTGSRPARVLTVEDDAILAMDLASELQGAGYDIVGPAHCLGRALELIKTSEIDAALLISALSNRPPIRRPKR